MLEARNGLERTAVRLAAERRTAADVAALVEGAQAVDDAVASGLPDEEIARRALEQERRLVRISGNPILSELFESIAVRVADTFLHCIRTLRSETELAGRVGALHRKAVDAIAAGDPDAASAAVTEKAELVRSCLDRIQFEES